MMKKTIISILTIISGLFLTIIVPAQELPVLTPDPSIKTGVLPNGLTYYVAVNASAKGHADFALVQRTGSQTVSDTASSFAISTAKDALAALPRIKSSSAQSWFASHGVSPSAEGFVNVTSDATVFRFNDVAFSSGKNVLDSALLVLMTMVDRATDTDDANLAKWYVPADQAVIVAGDVDAGVVASKLQTLSYMIPAGKSSPRAEYVWHEQDTAVFDLVGFPDTEISEVELEWRLPRAPREYMNTVQPAIYERFVRELGYIAERRIRQTLERQGIAVAEVLCMYRTSAEGPGDEIFRTSIVVAGNKVAEALSAAASTFASIDASAVTADEYGVARQVYLMELENEVENSFKDNSIYVDRCLSAYLRNASLASPKEKLNLHKSRSLTEEVQLKLFNDMASALLDGSKNIKVTCRSDQKYDESSLRDLFYASWSDSYNNPSSLDAFYEAPQVDWPSYDYKVKLKNVKSETMSGSSIWTFSNGMRVIYKKMNTSGRTYWTIALNGGYGSMDDLSAGEGAFVPDYFGCCRFAGIDGRTFKDMLMSEGMTLETRVGLTGTLFSGFAPKEKTERALQVMLAISNNRENDDEAFERYMADEELRLKFFRENRQERMAVIDSILCPDNKFSWMKSTGKISAALAQKADGFFKRQSMKMNDGVIIIVTDMAEDELKKIMLNNIGAFKTDGSAFRRPVFNYQPISGESTYTLKGVKESIDVVMTVPMALTMDNFMSAAIGSMVLEKILSDALSDTGMYADVKYNFQISPQERLSMAVSVEPLLKDGFSSHIEPADPMEALAIVRRELSDMTAEDVSAALLASSKEYLKSYLAQRMNEPMYWIDAIAKRFLDGKDFTTSYASRIDAVNAAKVKDVFAALNHGGKVEYVVQQ